MKPSRVTVVTFATDAVTSEAQLIYQQLGGKHFEQEFKATNFIYGNGFLSFAVPSENANLVRITYNYGTDDYTLTFEKLTLEGVEKVYEVDGIYCDQLTEVIENHI